MTGLAGAWQLTKFAGFRLVTVYLAVIPSKKLLSDLGWREESRGANLWFVEPTDFRVLQGATARDGIRCAHPIQVYLDLLAHPERAEDAAAEVRSRFLTWK